MILTSLLICIGIVVHIAVGQITTGTNLSACASIVRSCQSQCATTTQEKYVQWDYTLGGQLSCELMSVAAQSQVTSKALADQPNNPFLITFKVQCCSRSPSGTINATKMGNQQCPRAIIPTVLQDSLHQVVAVNTEYTNKMNMIFYVGVATLACCLLACWMIAAAICMHGRRSKGTKKEKMLGFQDKRGLMRESDKTTSSTYGTTSENSNENKADLGPSVRLHSGVLPYTHARENTPTQTSGKLDMQQHGIISHDVGCGFVVPVVTSKVATTPALSRSQTVKITAGTVEPPAGPMRNRSATTVVPRLNNHNRGEQVDLLEKYVFETMLTKNSKGKELHTATSTPNLSRITVTRNPLAVVDPLADDHI